MWSWGICLLSCKLLAALRCKQCSLVNMPSYVVVPVLRCFEGTCCNQWKFDLDFMINMYSLKTEIKCFASLLNHFTAEYNHLCLENGQMETLNLTDNVLQISRSLTKTYQNCWASSITSVCNRYYRKQILWNYGFIQNTILKEITFIFSSTNSQIK